jgi:hypothetical protein
MDPNVVASFDQLVRALMSGDNTQRGAAETAFNSAKEQPDTLFVCLVTLLRTSPDAQVRQEAQRGVARCARDRVAAVELRRIASSCPRALFICPRRCAR